MAFVFDTTKIQVGNAIRVIYTKTQTRTINGTVAGIFGSSLNVDFLSAGRMNAVIVQASDVVNGAVFIQWTDSDGIQYNSHNDELINGSGGSGSYLEIFNNLTEEQFWQRYYAGEIENGMFQYMMDVLGFQKFGDATFQFAQHPLSTYDRYTNYVETDNNYVFGNLDTNEPTSGMIILDKDGTNTRRIQFKFGGALERTYTYLGRGMGAVGIDMNGNVYCNGANPVNSNGAVVAFNSNDPLNDSLHFVSEVPSNMYTFYSFAYNGTSENQAICLDDSFAVNDGGIFGIAYNQYQPLIYFKNGTETARSSASYQFTNNLCVADKVNNRFFAVIGNALFRFDTTCTPYSTYTIYTPPGYSFQNISRMYLRNGRIWICAIMSNDMNQDKCIYNLIFDITTLTWIAQDPYIVTPNIKTMLFSNDKLEINNTIILSLFTEGTLYYIKWDYSSNSITNKQVIAMISYNDFTNIDVDKENNILRMYKNLDQMAQLEVINPDDFTSYSYISDEVVDTRGFTTIKAKSGFYYSFGYEANRAEVLTVDPLGNIDVTKMAANMSIPNRPMLTEHSKYIILNPSMRGMQINTIYDTMEKAISNNINNMTNFSYAMPFIRLTHDNLLKLNVMDFIYNNWARLAVIIEDWSTVTKIVSNGSIVLNSLGR